MYAPDPYLCRSLSKSHNFHLGFTSNTHLTTANTCSLNQASLLTLLDHLKAAKRPKSKDKNSYQRATHEEFRFPPIRDTSAALKIQASYFDKPFVITRPTQDEYVKDVPRRT